MAHPLEEPGNQDDDEHDENDDDQSSLDAHAFGPAAVVACAALA